MLGQLLLRRAPRPGGHRVPRGRRPPRGGWRRRWFEAALALYSVGLLLAYARGCDASVPGDDGYLWWCGRAGPEADDLAGAGPKVAFFLMLAVPVVAAFPAGTLRGLLLATGALTFAHAYPRKDFGARWCWSANAVSLLAVLAVAFPGARPG